MSLQRPWKLDHLPELQTASYASWMDASDPRGCGKLITGRMGFAGSREALTFLADASTELTLSVHSGIDAREKVIHRTNGRVLLFESPATTASSAQNRLGAALAEALSWPGAFFEIVEGVRAEVFESWTGGVELEVDPQAWQEALRPVGDLANAPVRTDEVPAVSACKSIEILTRLLPGARSKRLVLEHLARCYLRVGSSRRAALCWRDVAREWQAWGLPQARLDALEQAVTICPAFLDGLAELLSTAVALGQASRGEAALLRSWRELDASYLAPRFAELCTLLGAELKDAELLSAWGEMDLNAGKIKEGSRKLALAVTALVARGETLEAERLKALVARALPKKGRGSRSPREPLWRQLLPSSARRWAPLGLSLILLAAWFLLEVRAASALACLEVVGNAHASDHVLAKLRQEAQDLSGARDVDRVLELENVYLDRVYELEKAKLSRAMTLSDQQQLERARELLADIETGSPYLTLREGARALAVRLEARRQSLLERLEQASDLALDGRFERAFALQREILQAGSEDALFTGVRIPVRVDTVPTSARLTIADEDAGISPSWHLMPLDSGCMLEATLPGFQSVVVLEPARICVNQRQSTLRIALVPTSLVETVDGGGEIAAGIGVDDAVLPVVGADGVLRGLDVGKSWAWRLLPEPGELMRAAALVHGKLVLVATSKGAVLGVAPASGTINWQSTLGQGASRIRLGPAHKSNVLVSSEASVVLLNASNGRLVRRLDIGAARQPHFQDVSGDTAVVLSANGDWIGCDLESGKKLFEVKNRFGNVKTLQVVRDHVVVQQENGVVLVTSIDGQAERWRQKFPQEITIGVPGGQGLILVGSHAGVVQGLRLETGEPVWRAELDAALSDITVSTQSSARYFIAHTVRKGKRVFVAVSMQDGARLWEVTRGLAEASWAHCNPGLVVLSTPSTGVVVLQVPDDARSR